MLALCHEILSFDAAEPVWSPCPPIIYTKSHADALLGCLKDTYENNKLLAVQLLTMFPAEALGLDVSFVQFLCLPTNQNSFLDCALESQTLMFLVNYGFIFIG